MADVSQVTYEHSAGSTLSFFTNNLKIEWRRPGLSIAHTVDKGIIVTDTGAYQRVFTCTAELTGASVNTLNGWMVGAITYTGDYPRLTTIYLAGATTLTNVEVAITALSATDLGAGNWSVQVTFTEKTK